MKKYARLHLILLLCIAALAALCCLACHKDTGAAQNRFYEYDAEEEEYGHDYIEINDDKCVIYTQNGDDGKGITATGAFTAGEENKFEAECEFKITSLSDIMTDKELDELYEGLGAESVNFKFDAKAEFKIEGRRYSNAIEVTKQTAKISGFKGMLEDLNFNATSTDAELYCVKGAKPDLSVNITYELGEGTYNGKHSVMLKTDKDGKAVFPENVKRDGYGVKQYNFDAKDTDQYNSGVDKDHRFYYDDTLYAYYVKQYAVTFDINSSEYKIVGDNACTVLDGEQIEFPKIQKAVADPITRFMGWYDGNNQVNNYTRFTADARLSAMWYSEKTVNTYNDSIRSKGNNGYLYLHVVPEYMNRNDPYAQVYTWDITIKSLNSSPVIAYDDMNDSVDECGYVYDFDYAWRVQNRFPPEEDRATCSFDISVEVVNNASNENEKHAYTIPAGQFRYDKPNHLFFYANTGTFGTAW